MNLEYVEPFVRLMHTYTTSIINAYQIIYTGILEDTKTTQLSSLDLDHYMKRWFTYRTPNLLLQT